MINEELVAKFADKYTADPSNKAIENAIARVGLNEAAYNNEVLRDHSFVFSNETKRGQITNQKKSGRCWMFAALNTARVDTMKKLDVKSFEFSQNYTLFWDKLERVNYFLDSIIDTVDEDLSGRLVSHLLFDPLGDGGQWDMFAGLLKKYGAVPKNHMPETFHSSNTTVLDSFLTSKVREFAHTLREAYAKDGNVDALNDLKEEMLYTVYQVLVKTLGVPPKTVNYAYRDEDGEFHQLPEMSPQDFFAEYVGWDLDHRVSLINAPTEDKPFGRAFTVKYLGTVKEAKPIQYINVPIDVLKQAAVDAIKDGHPVWFGCDVGKLSDRKAGIMDMNIYDYADTVGGYTQLSKAERLNYGDSLLTHAMVLVGVDLDENGEPTNWKVENSWGEDVGDKGIFSMSDGWFDEYTYQIAVLENYVPEKWLAALDQPIIELEPWDPMGALARVK